MVAVGEIIWIVLLSQVPIVEFKAVPFSNAEVLGRFQTIAKRC